MVDGICNVSLVSLQTVTYSDCSDGKLSDVVLWDLYKKTEWVIQSVLVVEIEIAQKDYFEV